ncbi:hypothetical protein BD779DRAFT_1679476 [Infundibulicybe gibba]|nr:hypothetical protein BD779DRAFT_1679476 [Infundibulicybe gibba]
MKTSVDEVRTMRRRSWKAFLQIPLSPRSSDHPSAAAMQISGVMPADIILEIAELLSPSDILNLSLTSSQLRLLLLPALYGTLLLRSSRSCRLTLRMLSTRPEICVHIRKLALRPNYYLAWPKADEPLDEGRVVARVEKLAPSLVSLHTFDWDGLEMPADHLWETLRKSCPKLRTVFSNVGSRPLNPESSLFNFTGLTSFSLIVRHGLGGSELFPSLEALPERLWDMLLNRCPDLEELAICSFSSSARLFDFQRITDGHWPKLHTLTLGSFGYQNDFSLSPPTEATLGRFIGAHPCLKYMRLSWNFKRWMSPDNFFPMNLPASALPNLDTFIGIYQQLAELPNPSSITTLDLTCEPIYESRLPAICRVLQKLTSLTSLDLWTHVPDPDGDHTHFFRSILVSCPNLTDFHFMCTTSFTMKPLKQLSMQLCLLPCLKTFSLTKGHKYRDESMLQSALQIIRYNSSLRQINIRWAREKSPNHLKQEGTYDVTVDGDGHPTLLAHEKGIPLIGRPFERKFNYQLNPKGLVNKLAQKRSSIIQT